ncbi:hypothetical protein KY290_035908 [Solanum tuberosum]|uniref:U3 small nucleolar RNA-associated protein 13 C-terminal domain-containing protein n=1 Tax=Solanum tuberosum TaxID=4113 RepID=A0ABQ7TS35_SOLTU|nr:hypothetical protein KY290_035908 [Solanum tuberosum]
MSGKTRETSINRHFHGNIRRWMDFDQCRVVNLCNLHDYRCLTTIPTLESVETVCIIGSESPFSACLASSKHPQAKKRSDVPSINFITVGERGLVRIWSSDRALCLFEQKTSDITVSSDNEDLKRGFISALILPANQELLCVTADHQFFLYYPEESEGSMNLFLRKRFVGYNEEIADMKFLGDDEQFLAAATNVEQSCSYVLSGHTDTILCLDTCVSNSGRTLIVTGSKDNNVRLWDCENKACVGAGIGHMGAVGAVAFSKKQRNFFVSGSSDRTLKVWNMDGVSGNNEEIITLKAKAVVAAHDKDINSLAVAPTDSLVCSGSQDRTACIWSLPDLVSVVTLKGHKRGIWSVEFSPVDHCVLTASGDQTIKIWAISDGSCLRTLQGHRTSVLRASFLTRGTQLVSCDSDGFMKLWTVSNEECIATYDQHEDKIWALAIGKKTEMLATGGGDAVINLWHDSTASDKEEAFRKDEEGVLRGQELKNALIVADYTRAIQIAFELRRPHGLLDIFTELHRKRDAGDQIVKAVDAFSKEEQFCHTANFVLSCIPITKMIEIKGNEGVLEGLIAYTQRHFNRLGRLERESHMLGYTSYRMSVIEPEGKFENKDVTLCTGADNEQDIQEEKSSEKRKSDVSRDIAGKRVKR